MKTIPTHGTPRDVVEARMDELLKLDPDVEVHGRLTYFSMKGSWEVQELNKRAFRTFFFHDPLFGPHLPSLHTMHTELLDMCVSLLGGGPQARASTTSGGSESIFCAMHAAREWARATKPHITRPEVVVPYSAHPAFTKAGHYLGMDVRRVPLGSDYRADVAALAAAIGPRTIALVGSAPTWPHGLYDPIGDIAGLARERDLWMHVDACVGGYFAPFARKLGVPLPDWDLSVPGVCSLSADLHKWGYAPEPCSTVLYGTVELHAYQPFPVSEWPGGGYTTDGVTGSRPGGSIAAAWAIFHFLGEEGYLEIARRTLAVKQRLSDGIEAIPGLRPWDTDLVILVYESTGPALDIRSVANGLRKRGWANMGTQEPPLLHLSCDAVPDAVVDTYLTDLTAVVAEVRAGEHAVDELEYM